MKVSLHKILRVLRFLLFLHDKAHDTKDSQNLPKAK